MKKMKFFRKCTIMLTTLALLMVFSSVAAVNAKASGRRVDVIVTVSLDSAVGIFDSSRFLTVNDFISSEEGKIALEDINKRVRLIAAEAERQTDFELETVYDTLICGFSGSISEGDIPSLKKIAGVTAVEKTRLYEYTQAEDGLYYTSDAAPLGSLAPPLNDTGVFDSSELDYHGEGMIIGVLDTGLSVEHEVFSIDPTSPKIQDGEYLRNLDLHAFEVSNVMPTTAYHTQKIIFGFDYAGKDVNTSTEAPQNSGYHGNHVAGITAGNSPNGYKGVAYEAQIAFGKVFDSDGRAANNDIIMGMEDMIKLGADVVNLSLGAPCGKSFDPIIAEVFENADESGVLFCYASGNSAHTTTSILNPDNGTTSSDASIEGSFAVGSFNIDLNTAGESSYGPTPAMTLKPDIAGVGINVYGAYATEGRFMYANLSGTSMASPNVAGGMLLLKQKYMETLQLSELNATLKRIAMSNAYVMRTEVEGVALPFTPRLQGSGMLDLPAALSAESYIRVENSDYAKLSLGSDVEREGVIEASFYVVNTSEDEMDFELSIDVLTETYVLRDNKEVMGQRPHLLNPEVTFTVSGQEVNSVTVDADSEKKVDVKIVLSQQDKEYLELFPNGMYVEGYVYLEGENDLSIPFLSYYGDWAKDIPQFEEPIYKDNVLGGSFVQYNYYNDQLNGSAKLGESSGIYDERFSALSYFGDTVSLTVNTYFLRNVIEFEVTISDYYSGELLCRSEYDGGIKYYNRNDGVQQISVSFDMAELIGGNLLANNQKYVITVNGRGDYGDGKPLTFPFIMDIEKPVLSSVALSSEGGGLIATTAISDNHYIKSLDFLKKDGTRYTNLKSVTVENQPFSVTDVETDLTQVYNGTDRLYIRVSDLANNYSMYQYDPSTQSLSELKGSAVTPTEDFRTREYSDTYEENGATYADTPNGRVLISYSGNAEEFNVPEGVYRIEAEAFRDSTIKRVTFPESLIQIGSKAFYGSGLKEIDSYAQVAPVLEFNYNDLAESEHPYLNFPIGILLNNLGEAEGYDNAAWEKFFAETYSVTYMFGTELLGASRLQTGEELELNYEREGYVLEGWYLDTQLTQRFTESVMGDHDLIIYANLVKIEFRITFEGADVGTVKVKYGELPELPEDPTKPGYKFVGWFVDEDCTTEYEPSAVTEGFTLYAGWEKQAGCAACSTVSVGGGVFTLLITALGGVLILRRRRACAK